MSVLSCCALLSVAEGQTLHSVQTLRVDAQHNGRLRSESHIVLQGHLRLQGQESLH